MTANYKFEARLQELGIYNDWCQQGRIGRVAVETKEGISILVHENYNDGYSEFRYPPMAVMQEKDDFRYGALIDFYDTIEDLKALVEWVVCPTNPCPLEPVDVYFIGELLEEIQFEDDKETIEDVLKHYETTEEWCPHCDECVELEHDLRVQKCPVCGKWIVPCSVCPLTDCSTKCPLERLAIIMNKE